MAEPAVSLSRKHACRLSPFTRARRRIGTGIGRIAIAATLLLGVTILAHAQAAVERAVKAVPGRDVRVGVYADVRADCSSGPLPGIRLAVAPAHGTVTVKRATLKATNLKQCLAIEVPALVAFYRAMPGFTGSDEFELELSLSAGRKQRQHFRVTVSNDSAGGQGI